MYHSNLGSREIQKKEHAPCDPVLTLSSDLGTYTTVKATVCPWFSGKSPQDLFTYSLFRAPACFGVSSDCLPSYSKFRVQGPWGGVRAVQGLPGWSSPGHPGVELRANLRPISHRCHLLEVALVCELTQETIHLPLGCLQGLGVAGLTHLGCEGGAIHNPERKQLLCSQASLNLTFLSNRLGCQVSCGPPASCPFLLYFFRA